MNDKPTDLELELLASVELLQHEKALLQNQLNNAIAEIARLKTLNQCK
jgi:hypothetical protein